MIRHKYLSVACRFLLLASLTFTLAGCNEVLVAPQGSTIKVLPEGAELGATGIPGDRTFVSIIAEVQNAEGLPLQEIEVIVDSLLRMIDSDGNYVDSPATFTTDSTGRIRLSVEVTLGLDQSIEVFFQSSAASASATVSTASSS